MDFNWNIEDEIVVALENPDYSDFSIYESYVQSLAGEQPSDFLDPALLSGTEWTSACVDPTAAPEAYLDPPSKPEQSAPCTEAQALSCERSDAVDYKIALLGLEQRLNALEECRESVERRVGELEEKVKSLRSGLEEDKTRFCREIDDHIAQLRGWASEVQGIFGRVTGYKRQN